MSDTHATLRLRRELVEAARDEAGLSGRSTAAQIEHWARLGRAVEAARCATAERVRQALQGRLPIEALMDVEQDAVFDGMLDAYRDPPAGIRDRLAGIAERTRKALDGGRAGQDAG